MVVSAGLFLIVFVDDRLPGRLHQHASLGGIAHHGFQSCLFLLLYGQHGICLDLGGSVPRCVCILQRHEALFGRVFLHGLSLVSLDEPVQPPLAQ